MDFFYSLLSPDEISTDEAPLLNYNYHVSMPCSLEQNVTKEKLLFDLTKGHLN